MQIETNLQTWEETRPGKVTEEFTQEYQYFKMTQLIGVPWIPFVSRLL